VPDRGSVRRLAGRGSGARASRCARCATGRGRPGRSKGTRGGSFARSAIPHGAGRPAPTSSCGYPGSTVGTAPPISRHAAGAQCTRHGASRGAAGTTRLADREPHRPIGPVPLRRGRPPEPPRPGSQGPSRRRTLTAAGSGRPRDPVPRTPRRADRLGARVGPGLDRLTPAERGHRPSRTFALGRRAPLGSRDRGRPRSRDGLPAEASRRSARMRRPNEQRPGWLPNVKETGGSRRGGALGGARGPGW